jgi:8-oxo-dGTP pyrophosphatase MutT (NUDIX family)
MEETKVHVVSATAIIIRGKKILIAQRNDQPPFPNQWTVPGGKITTEDYIRFSPNKQGLWYGAVERAVRREVKEEVGLTIGPLRYVCEMTFIRPDKKPGLILSYYAYYQKGRVRLGPDLVDFAWVTPKKAEKYDLIDGIIDEIRIVTKKANL